MSGICFAELAVAPGVTLRAAAPGDADEFALVECNRAYLEQWLAWVPHTRDSEAINAFISGACEDARRGTALTALIRDGRAIVGAVGLHHIDRLTRGAEIGYWLAERAGGRGIMTAAARALVEYAFGELGLHRMELVAAVGNVRSRRLAERLGMTHEATLRERLFINGVFHDAALYVRLAR